jgi:hypothetical protein
VLVWEPGKKVPMHAFPRQRPADRMPLQGIRVVPGCGARRRRHRGLFWSYLAPFREVSAIKGYLAPYNERVDLTVDGHPQERAGGPLGPPAEPSTPTA